MNTLKQPRWIAAVARAGYAARGVVYCVLGGLIFLAAFEAAQETDTKGAVRALMDQPFGNFLVGFLILGLLSYVAWRLLQAVFDPDDLGVGAKGLFVRAGLVASAFSYSALALYAGSLVFALNTQGGGEGGNAALNLLNGVFSLKTITLGLAIVFAGIAVAHWWKAFASTYAKYFKADEATMRIIHVVSTVGLAARGLIFATLSWLLVLRFFNLRGSDGGETKPGLQDALSYFGELPYGQWVLAGIGIGLFAFALYSLAESRWRRIREPDIA